MLFTFCNCFFLMYRSQSQGLTVGIQPSLSFLSCVELSVVCFRLIDVSVRLNSSVCDKFLTDGG